MPRTSKTRLQLMILGAVIVAIVGALAYLVLSGASGAKQIPQYVAPTVRKDFAQSVFSNPEYSKLEKPPIALPLDPGPKGRDNPFEAY